MVLQINAQEPTVDIYLHLLRPPSLDTNYCLESAEKGQIQKALQTLQQALQERAITQDRLSQLNAALEQLGPVDVTLMEDNFQTGTALKPEHAQVVDGLMDIRHVASPEPARVVAVSLLKSAISCLELLRTFPDFDTVEASRLRQGFVHYAALFARTCGLDETEIAYDGSLSTLAPPANTALQEKEISLEGKDVNYPWVWVQGHWVFLTLMQGLILSFRRFRAAVEAEDMDLARTELACASNLMWASGASMQLAGNFENQIYQTIIRAAMTTDDPSSTVEIEVSGIMFWDHHYLVNAVWKKEVASLLRNLPAELEDAHTEFVEAYRDGLSTGHIDICARFGGRENSSLLSSNMMAVDFLKNIGRSRLRRIDPTQRVAASIDDSLVRLHEAQLSFDQN